MALKKEAEQPPMTSPCFENHGALNAMGPNPWVTSDLVGACVTLVNNYTGSDNASAVYPVGTTNVVWTATTGSGSTSVVPQQVVVVDAEAPIAACQNITVELDAAGQAVITPSDVDGGSSDNWRQSSICPSIKTPSHALI